VNVFLLRLWQRYFKRPRYYHGIPEDLLDQLAEEKYGKKWLSDKNTRTPKKPSDKLGTTFSSTGRCPTTPQSL
jgi:hypothetical protein